MTRLRYKVKTAPKTDSPLTVKALWPKQDRVGQRQTIQVKLSSKQDLEYVMVSVPIPAGARIIPGTGRGKFADFVSRHEQVHFFLDKLPAGPCSLSFDLLWQTPGQFTVFAPQVEPMYQPNLGAVGVEHRIKLK